MMPSSLIHQNEIESVDKLRSKEQFGKFSYFFDEIIHFKKRSQINLSFTKQSLERYHLWTHPQKWKIRHGNKQSTKLMTQGSNPSRKIQVIKTLAVRGTNNHVCVTSFLYQYCSEVILSRFLCEIFLTVFNCLLWQVMSWELKGLSNNTWHSCGVVRDNVTKYHMVGLANVSCDIISNFEPYLWTNPKGNF